MKTPEENTAPGDLGQIPAAIAQLAASMDADLGGTTAMPGQDSQAAQAAQEAAVVNQGEDLGAMLQLGVGMLEDAAPYIKPTLTPEWCEKHGQLIAAVAQKRGWDLGRFLEPEYVLAGSLVITALKIGKDAKSYYAWLEDQQARARSAGQSSAVHATPEPVAG